MRIFIQSSAYLPTPTAGAGAVETIVAQLAGGLADRGHEVTLFALDGSDVPGVALVTPSSASKQLRERPPGPGTEAILAALVSRERNQGPEPEVFFDHSQFMAAQHLLTGVPTVSMVHGMAPVPPHARNVAFVSEHHGRVLHRRPNALALHLGIDLATVPEPDPALARHIWTLWAGRILAYKRPHVAQAIADRADVPLRIIGPVVDVPYARERGIMTEGERPRDDILAAMRGARAFLFTSDDSEPAGLVMLEALASGCPVMAFAHGANREYLPLNRTMYLDPHGDAIKQGGAMLLHQNTVKIPELASELRAWVAEHRSMNRMIDKAEALLRDTMEGSSLVTNLNTAEHWDGIYTNWRNEGTVDLKREQMREAHAAIIELVPPATPAHSGAALRFIDVGCGPGLLLEEMERHRPGYELVGADFSDTALEIARGLAPAARLDQIDVIAGLPYSSETFDVVFCGHIIEHLVRPVDLLREMRRLCVPGGLVIVNFPHGDQPYEMHIHDALTDDVVKDWMIEAGIQVTGSVPVIPGPPVDQGIIYGRHVASYPPGLP